jgi:hypothetical protein
VPPTFEPPFDHLGRRSCEVFLADMPGTVTQGQLRAYVEAAGLVPLEVTPLRNPRGDVRSAVVLFRTAAEADRALAELPARPLLGCTLRVRRRLPPGASPPRPTATGAGSGAGDAHVFLSNVPHRAVEADLENLIAPTAAVVRVRLITTATGATAAFVWLRDPTETDEAIAALDGVELFGRELRVMRAERRV